MPDISICPTVTAFDKHDYRRQMEVACSLSQHIHIDLMDGLFAPSTSPPLSSIWWNDGIEADIHLMYNRPADYLNELIRLKPSSVIVHFEAELDHSSFAKSLHDNGIKAGLALLADTAVADAQTVADSFDQILIFSGHLGYHGGKADLGLIDKVKQAKQMLSGKTIAWDGGINDTNANSLIEAGVSVLNVGGYIMGSSDPEAAYDKIKALI